jgi:hypothetical protein
MHRASLGVISMIVRTSFANLLAIGMIATALCSAAQSPAPAPASIDPTTPPAAAPAPTESSPAAPAVAPAAVASAKGKHVKEVYSGPTTIVVLPPNPMLDAEGKQRVDPDGKLMFNPPVKQLRDKKGHPVFDAGNKPVFQTATILGFDEKGKKILAKKVKPPKMTPISISAGILTVDGWTGKARLNYDIADLKFLYIYAPGIGITIVSQNTFPGAKEQPGAFNGKDLRITVEGHPIELSSEKLLLGKKPQPAWVAVDRGFLLPAKFPVFGYGTVVKAPYAWPGSKELASKGPIQAPPLPTDVRPTLLLAPCPAGMMRPAGPPVLPGQKAQVQPCMPIQSSSASAATPANAANAATAATPVPAPPQ